MKDRILIALSGFIGGVGPSLAELASLAKENQIPELPFFVGAIIIGIMGMAVAIIAKETVPWKAFTQGMGAPTLFSSATTAVTSVVASGSFIIGTAYAQTDTVPVLPIESKKKVVIMIDEGKTIRRGSPGDTLIFEKDGYKKSYKIPDRDTVKIELYVHDPALSRSLIQGLLPMQNKLTKRFEPTLKIRKRHK